MRKDWSVAEPYRRRMPGTRFESKPGERFGCFSIPFECVILNCIVTEGDSRDPVAGAWEHVSIHAFDPIFKKDKTPSWKEMAYIASVFWEDNETVVQYRPAKEEYVNVHEHVLHWWKPVGRDVDTPPKICV
jgi:hypothetical protein